MHAAQAAQKTAQEKRLVAKEKRIDPRGERACRILADRPEPQAPTGVEEKPPDQYRQREYQVDQES